jgi:hypothetical protein
MEEEKKPFSQDATSNVTLDHILRTIAALALAGSTSISAWCLKEVNVHGNRLTRLETQNDEVYRTMVEIRLDLKEIKAELRKP